MFELDTYPFITGSRVNEVVNFRDKADIDKLMSFFSTPTLVPDQYNFYKTEDVLNSAKLSVDRYGCNGCVHIDLSITSSTIEVYDVGYSDKSFYEHNIEMFSNIARFAKGKILSTSVFVLSVGHYIELLKNTFEIHDPDIDIPFCANSIDNINAFLQL